MLTCNQVKNLRILQKQSTLHEQSGPLLFNLFYQQPHIIDHLINFGKDPDTEVAEALRLAVAGEQADVAALMAMLEANPRLLLQAGNVRTRSGLLVTRVTVYEFCLGAGDPELAKQIQPYFAKIVDENGKLFSEKRGEEERARQYEPYRPHIEALARQIELGQSAYDLRLLFNLIQRSSEEEITDVLSKKDNCESALCKELMKFRNAVKRSESKGIGLHYEHYTTLIQASKLLGSELCMNNASEDKCDLVARQIIGYLQRDLPTIDRIAFARAFTDDIRTLEFSSILGIGSFPDTTGTDAIHLGYDEWIYGYASERAGLWADVYGRQFKFTCLAKTSSLLNLCTTLAQTDGARKELIS